MSTRLLQRQILDRNLFVERIGLVFSAGGVGSFLGAWFGARVTGRYGYGRVLLITLILGNSAPAAAVFARGSATVALAVLLAAFFVMGIGSGVANVHAVSLRQSAVPDSVRGRVNAGYRLISWGAIPVGASLGGLLAGQLGARTAMLIGAFGIPLATLWVAASAVPRLATIYDAHIGSTDDSVTPDPPTQP
jgi:MFS family permease